MSTVKLVQRLASRSALTEAEIQADIRSLLVDGGLELDEHEVVSLESQAGGGRRIDIETGTTIIEVKKDLRNAAARTKAVAQLLGYVQTRTTETGSSYVGIVTDGVLWQLHVSGQDAPVHSLILSGADSDAGELTAWLEAVLATANEISPSPSEIRRRLGSQSPAFAAEHTTLRALYELNRDNTEIALKRELWARLLKTALGDQFADTDDLFVLHTYLVVTAELIAHTAVGLPVVGPSASDLLTGEVFRAARIGGVVDADFFDWPADVEGGTRFIQSLARRVARFRWDSVEHDILKALYESVIDAETRKQLGEYYTPDWLAEGVVEETVTDPLNQRVLDPSCGSGTFIFWSVRKYLARAEAAGTPNDEAIRGVVEHVAGIDLHPVAVALARVTYLLAIGVERLKGNRPAFSVPVYLGDSLRWDQDDTLLGSNGITIFTTRSGATDQSELFERQLHFPEAVVADAGRFDQLVADLALRASRRERGTKPPSVSGVMNRFGVSEKDQGAVQSAFLTLCALHDDRRDHIWGYYLRNLARPLAFTRPQGMVDILVGNPPWLSYRHMTNAMQRRYKEMSTDRGLWAGGSVSTHQDLSDLFVVRAIEQYLKPDGRFGFVMPAAVLSRRQYAGFRRGHFEAQAAITTVQFQRAWDLRRIKPAFFPVPSAVVFGARARVAEPMPRSSAEFSGRTTKTDGSWGAIKAKLTTTQGDEPTTGSAPPLRSPYSPRFYQGAVLIPRVLVCVRPSAAPLGVASGSSQVSSQRSSLEKEPWKSVATLHGAVEDAFLRATLFGQSIAPFRVLDASALAVIPWSQGALLTGSDGRMDNYPGLADWWREAERLWLANRSDSTRLSLTEQIDYFGKLSSQTPMGRHRVLYTKSGNRIAACRLSDSDAIIDHTLYWGAMRSSEEAQYVTAILNSEALHAQIEPLMSEGLFGKRHVDKYAFSVPFPIFDEAIALHAEIAQLGAAAERLASATDIPEGAGFQAARKTIRERIVADEVGAELEACVARLLDARLP